MIDLLAHSPFDPASERRIVIVADWLPPDFGAVGQYMQVRARSLAERGHEVTLVGLASSAASLRVEAVAAGLLTEIRLKARPAPRASLAARLAWTILTDLRLVVAAFGRLRAADGIVFTGSPPFLIHVLAPLRLLWRAKLVYRITDFHPECLIAAQERPSRMLGLLLALTNFWRRRVDCFEVLGEDQMKRLLATGIPPERIALVRDGSPVEFVQGQMAEPLPAELTEKCVLLYSGNYGIAHEVETVAEGYRRHHRLGSGRVHLWLSATGAGAEELCRRFEAERLPYFRSKPVPLERLAGLLLSPHAHLISLKDSFVGFVMPSKIYACIASRRPIVFVGSAQSDVDLLAQRGEAAYFRISCGDYAGFADCLERLANETVRLQEMQGSQLST